MNDEKNELLRKIGLRATAQRRAVIDVISAEGGHLTAEEIYDKARQLNPGISLATVYRTLTALKDAGMIEQRYLTREHGRAHFEKAGASGNFYFKCMGCGKIIEFESQHIVETVQREFHNPDVADLVQICMCLDGYCQDCHNARKDVLLVQESQPS
ncbi:MAG: transcriptional repressor [Anaerolineae bacterium]|nr:transcriptional repressor [Anaerolineae bacterium]